MTDEDSCGLCKKYVRFPERQFYYDYHTKQYLHRHCAGMIQRGVYKWDEASKKYKKTEVAI